MLGAKTPEYVALARHALGERIRLPGSGPREPWSAKALGKKSIHSVFSRVWTSKSIPSP